MLPKAHLNLHSEMSGSRWVITPSWLSESLRSFLYSFSMYSYHLFLYILLLLGPCCFCPLLCPSLHEMKKTFLSLLVILWNSAFRWIYLSFSPFPFVSHLFSAFCQASSDNYFAFLHFFFRMILITASCTMLQTSVHSSLGTLSIWSNPMNLFVTSTA